jgi:hypothetical protein
VRGWQAGRQTEQQKKERNCGLDIKKIIIKSKKSQIELNIKGTYDVPQ